MLPGFPSSLSISLQNHALQSLVILYISVLLVVICSFIFIYLVLIFINLNLAKGLPVLFFFSNNQLLVFCCCFLLIFESLLLFCSDICQFLPCINFGLSSYFPNFLTYNVRLFENFLLFEVVYCSKLPLGTAFAVSHKFQYVCFCFCLSQDILTSSLTQQFFRSILFDFHIFVNFPRFLLLLI